MTTRCVHATHTLGTRQKNARRAGHALEARWVRAHGALGVRYTSVDEHTTHAQRVPRVCRALVQRALRMAGVLLACTFMRRAPRTVLCMHKNPDAHNERRRMHSVGPARSTHEYRMVTHTQRTTTHWPKLLLFQRAGRASFRCDWRLS